MKTERIKNDYRVRSIRLSDEVYEELKKRKRFSWDFTFREIFNIRKDK